MSFIHFYGRSNGDGRSFDSVCLLLYTILPMETNSNGKNVNRSHLSLLICLALASSSDVLHPWHVLLNEIFHTHLSASTLNGWYFCTIYSTSSSLDNIGEIWTVSKSYYLNLVYQCRKISENQLKNSWELQTNRNQVCWCSSFDCIQNRL